MDLIISILNDGITHSNKKKVRLLKIRVARYMIYNDKSYHHSFILQFLKYMDKEDASYTLWESLEEIYENHWPGIKQDDWEFTRKYDKC